MSGASSAEMTDGERTLFRRAPLGPASLGTGRIYRTTRGMGTRGGGRRIAGVIRDAGGRRRVGGAFVGKTDDIRASNNKSTEIVRIDVRPLETVVHSREGGEIACGWFVSASILHVDLTTAEGRSSS